MKPESLDTYFNNRIAKVTSIGLGCIIATPAFMVVVFAVLEKIV